MRGSIYALLSLWGLARALAYGPVAVLRFFLRRAAIGAILRWL